MIHNMKLGNEPFIKIKNGEKVIESRLFDEKRKAINIGDEIEFISNENQTEKILTNVIALYRYQTFEELFSDFPSEYFGQNSKEDLLREIEQIYSDEDQKKYGVLGIRIKRT
ncbi:ASCH domain-containing protein [bacterium]|nr:ASCH domain-containing protein [bacterium]